MQIPAEIDFQGLDASPSIESSVSEHIAELERRYGRMTACRVVIKGPGDRHRTGGLYEVNIHLVLPEGREVSVTRTPSQDERHAQLIFAIDDAFKRARRQLQDHVRKLQGQIKQHEAVASGTVLRIDKSGTFGVLETGDGREVYFHRNSVWDDAFDRIAPGTRVTFSEEMGQKGPQASTVRILGKHGLRV